MPNAVRRVLAAFVALSSIALSSIAVPAFAHHGWSDYDANQEMTLKGRIEASSYENPHATIRLAADGRTYEVVLAPVSRMEARGVPRESVAVGQNVTVVGYPSRTHAGEVRAERIVVGDKNGARTVELR